MNKVFDVSLTAIDDYFDNVTDEQLEEDLKQAGYYRNSCQPDICQMQCQGAGWCYLCQEFRGELNDESDDCWEEFLP